MLNPIAKRLAALPKTSRDALCELWKQRFNFDPPGLLRRDLMLSILAHRIQEQAFGALNAGCRTRLRQLAQAFETDPKVAMHAAPAIKPGTRLVRKWQNKIHVVHVAEKGYEYNGSRYQSLSEIARLITGTRWSGPAFFGLNGKRANFRKEAA